MRTWYQKMKKKSDEKGTTLIEILVTMAIMSFALIGILLSVSTGLTLMKNRQIERTAAECARILLEYVSTINVDRLYEDHTPVGSFSFGSFSGGGGLPALNSFVSGANSACRELSASDNPLGSEVQMAYGICPGCIAHTEVDAETLVEWHSCAYFVNVVITYHQLSLGSPKTISYYKQFEANRMDKCEDICGVGNPPGGDPDKVYECPDS